MLRMLAHPGSEAQGAERNRGQQEEAGAVAAVKGAAAAYNMWLDDDLRAYRMMKREK